MSFGRFKGDVAAKWLTHRGDDRNMKLLEDFEYIDQHGTSWDAPKGSIVNGASIPSALWSTVGPPFVGDYRRASVVHDVACDKRSESHEAVHEMFYNAMRADGVGWTKANVMYQAVKRFGPRWGSTGSLSRRRKPKDADVLAFAKAVEIAAEQVDESQGPEAVEERADQILIANLNEQASSSDKPSSRTKPKSNRRPRNSISKVSKTRTKKTTRRDNESAFPISVNKMNPAVRKQLSGTQLLKSFRAAEVNALESLVRSYVSKQSLFNAGDPTASGGLVDRVEDGLSSDDRLTLVDQALILLEQNYVHRPLKEAMYAINPVQRLKLLREEVLLDDSTAHFDGDIDFHRKLLSIILSTRDLHTNYFLPSPFAKTTAYIPFLVEDYFDADDSPNQRRFMVTRTIGSTSGTFLPGVELLRWNGIPIERAVEINGERFAGSNREASRARGLETLTVRPLIQSLPPDEDFVIIEYRTPDGLTAEERFDWLVFSPDTSDFAALQDFDRLTATAQGIDLEQAMVRLAKRVLFAPEAVADAVRMAKRTQATKGQGLQSLLPDVLEARAITVNSKDYAYLRIRTFSVNDADRFVREVTRLLELLPQEGLIIDVRGNGGGLILAGEQLLQLFTPRTIEPTLFQFVNTPLNRRMVEHVGFLSQWKDSMRQAVQTGAVFSQGFPITSPEKANEIGQRYHGPVVLITDALCYSTTDIFAAGFQDHEIGTIVGIDNNTGAGGANVWTHSLLQDFLSDDAESPYRQLPADTAMRVSIRRTIRVGKSNGTILEDLGVVPEVLHPMTRDDLLKDNIDLLASAASILNEQTTRRLSTDIVVQGSDETTITVDTVGLDRIDIFDGSRPLGSIDVEDGSTEFSVAQTSFSKLRFLGYEDDELVASRIA